MVRLSSPGMILLKLKVPPEGSTYIGAVLIAPVAGFLSIAGGVMRIGRKQERMPSVHRQSAGELAGTARLGENNPKGVRESPRLLSASQRLL